LAAEQCRVVLADQNVEAMEEAAKGFLDIAQRSRSTLSSCIVECNVTDPNQVNRLMEEADAFAASSAWPEDDSSATLLVNCAGITRDNWISKMDVDEEWQTVIDVNLTGTFLTCRAFLSEQRIQEQLLVGEGGPKAAAIVNVGSIVSELGNMGQVNYAASKGGVLGLTRSLAKEVASRGVRVNAVVPGFIDTPMAQAVPDHIRERIIPKIPLGRFGTAEEVANLVNFLLSPRSGYITGESIAVSGMISL
jgi:NAD(P)-dependent dehydrogenase (short-subunit alcohol dehydrogenase family)